ncbi:MAG TPA: hypothetical protein VMR18_02775 [Candidatus Saccharimonadales bacterium]|nr:hypothetical protein [Candidatus Saccharimonadales bacterium]
MTTAKGLIVSGLAKKRLPNLLTSSSGHSNKVLEQLPDDNQTDSLITLLDEFKKIDLNSPMAKLNETTISDNNGGRIEL